MDRPGGFLPNYPPMASNEQQHSIQELQIRFQAALEQSLGEGASVLAQAHPADAAAWLQDLEQDLAWSVFCVLSSEDQASLLEYAEDDLTHLLVPRMSAEDLREVVEELPSDEAVDVLAEADASIAEDVLESIPDEDARELRELASYPPESAGGVMTTEFVLAPVEARIGDVVKEVKKEGEQAEENLGVFVVDEQGRPVGYVSDRDLLTHSIHDSVSQVMVAPFIVDAGEDQEVAANIISKYGLASLAVTGPTGELLGVISLDDAQDILEDEATEDAHRLVGTSPVQQTRLPVLVRVRQRMPLMGVTVVGGLASAKMMELFMQAGADAAGGILRYLPLIVGLAGNVGVQISTILVRGFATGEVDQDRDREVFLTEFSVGAIIGLICGLATFLVASWMEGNGAFDWTLGLSVGIAVQASVAWAAALGGLVPMLCRRLKIDPAIVAGPFLIALSDISGVVIYIVIANQLMGWLGQG